MDGAARLDSKNAITYYNHGVAKASKGDLDGAIADFTRAIKLDPEYVNAYSYRGYVKQLKGDWDGAIDDCTCAITLDPKHAHAYNIRGAANVSKGDRDGAIADFTSTIELDPRYVDAYNNRGQIMLLKGDLDGAIADFNYAIKLDPKNGDTYFSRGSTYFLEHNWTDALADFNRCRKLGSKNRKYARLLIWLIQTRMGEKDAADRTLSACLDRSWNDAPEDWLSKIAGFLLDRINEADFLAAAASTDAEKAGGQVCEAWFYAGIKRLLAGDSTTAADDFRKCLETGKKSFSEYKFARAELEALHVPHATPNDSTPSVVDSANAEQTCDTTNRLIDHALAVNRPSESQMDRVRRLGFVLKDGEAFTMRELDELLNSANQRPDPQDLAKLQSLKIDLSSGNALDCRVMIELDEAFRSDDEFSPLGPVDIAKACAEAAKDPDLFKVRLRRSASHGGLVFSWPQAKLRQWASQVR